MNDPRAGGAEAKRHVAAFVVEGVLGTRCDLEVASASKEASDRIADRVFETIERLEAVFSVFLPTSELRGFQETGETANADLQAVIALAADWCERSDGAFHPGIDRLRQRWLEAEAAGAAPTPDQLRPLIHELGQGISHRSLNLNAIAKGWITDRAVEAALHPVDPNDDVPERVLLSVGGDLVHRGPGSANVGIEDPHQPFDNVPLLAVTQLSNQALATSGNVRRSVTIGGQSFGHVLDPRTGMSVDHMASASVIAADAATADVLATICMVLDPAQGLALVEDTPLAACLLATAAGEVHTSTRWVTLD